MITVDYLDVDACGDKDLVIYTSKFPINRWLKAESQITVSEFDSLLPQDDSFKDIRASELHAKRQTYIYSQKVNGAPPMVGSRSNMYFRKKTDLSDRSSQNRYTMCHSR